MIHNINKLHLTIYSNKKLLFLIVRTFQNIYFFLYFWSQKMQPLQAFIYFTHLLFKIGKY